MIISDLTLDVLLFRPLKNDGSNVILTRGQGEEGLLTTQTQEPVDQLLFVSYGAAQVEGLCQTFEIWSQEEVQNFTQIL